MTRIPPDFTSVIKELQQERLADSVVSAIEDRFGYDAVTRDELSIPRPFRLVHIVYQTTGFLGGDGLEGLLRLPCRTAYPVYLQELGFHKLGRTLRRYVRWHFLYGNTRVRAAEQELYRNKYRIRNSIAEYIIDNAVEFEPLLPQVRQTLAYLEHFDPAEHERRLNEPDPRTELLNAVAEGLRSGEMTLQQAREMLGAERNG